MQEEIDGRLVLRLKVPLSSELQRWVLQFGSEAEVLAPAALRKAVGEELKRALAAYSSRRASSART
jgi:predicted DNA-binding transcriptional regulator YafY